MNGQNARRAPAAGLAHTDPATFREQIDTTFLADHRSGPVHLRLVEVADECVSGGVQQFSIFFHGPAHRVLPQGTYSLQHDVLGSVMVFVVPVIGSTLERIVYQACFSRPVPSSPARRQTGD